LPEIASADGKAWSATSDRLANVSLDDFHDSLDFEFNVPENSGELALVLNMRNSMLNTVLLYDVMLKEQSFAALDWMGHDLKHLGKSGATASFERLAESAIKVRSHGVSEPLYWTP
jgi:hypothetical protein